MNPIKLKLGPLPKPAQPQLTPVPGAPPPLQQNNSVRPTAVGAQATVKSPKAKKPDSGMAKSDGSNKGIGKLKMFMDSRAVKKNKVVNK